MSKLYVWVLSKMSPTQKGIQGMHVLHELVMNYTLNPDADAPDRNLLNEWVASAAGKTVVVLEGGSHQDQDNFYDMLTNMPEDLFYPFDYWPESDLNGAYGAVGIVLDERWDENARMSLAQNWQLSEWEKLLLNKLVTSREVK